MLFLHASWVTLHVFYPMKRWHSHRCNEQDRPDLIVVKREVSLLTQKHSGKFFLPILP